MGKPLASISLDLDNQWSYMKIHGEEGWDSYPSYYERFVPYALEILEDLDIKITFFLVGQDAAFERNHQYIRMITDAGHRIGNHSFKHETWLHLYSREELREEISSAHEVLKRVSGQTPIGFRGPGFSWSHTVLDVLSEKGYQYDASTLPTVIGPLARWYYFRTSGLSKQERKDRKEIFGKFSDGFRRLRPYMFEFKSGKKLLEIPVTTMPLFRIPFHLSYLLYLSGISEGLMMFYLKTALFLCRLTGTQPSFLLHPLDLIGGDQLTELDFFPGMQISSETKKRIFKKVMGTLGKHYTLVPMEEHANSILHEKNGTNIPLKKVS